MRNQPRADAIKKSVQLNGIMIVLLLMQVMIVRISEPSVAIGFIAEWAFAGFQYPYNDVATSTANFYAHAESGLWGASLWPLYLFGLSWLIAVVVACSKGGKLSWMLPALSAFVLLAGANSLTISWYAFVIASMFNILSTMNLLRNKLMLTNVVESLYP